MADGSNKARTRLRRARPLLGTFVEVEAEGPPGADLDAAIDAAFTEVAEVHRLMSFHEPNSDISRLNREAHMRPIVVHDWTYRVLQAAIELNRRSGGVFDIAVAPVLQAKGLLPRLVGQAAIAGAAPRDGLELLAGRAVRFGSPDVRIDVGGIAKGFAADRARAALGRFGVTSGIVNAGGDLVAFGNAPQTVHVRDPRDPRRLICSIALANEALASTGRRFDPFQSGGTDEAAVIDPATRSPATGFAGVTVRAPSCVIADALTKVVMLLGTDAGELLAYYGAGALLVSPGGDVQVTPNLSGSINRAA
jgi:thiamine biosynthesis lipoprotein